MTELDRLIQDAIRTLAPSMREAVAKEKKRQLQVAVDQAPKTNAMLERWGKL